jgi:TMEM175 potassium channel family protein
VPFRPRNDAEQPRSRGVETRRLEAFSDGVFAIAITLLALNLQVPELIAATPHALATTLAARWPTYLSFLLSFVTLLIAWVYHHRLLEGVQVAGTRLFFTNGMLLLVVSSVPFPTALLGAFLTTPAASVACAIYAAYIGLLNGGYNLLWWEVERPRRQSEGPGWRPPTSMTLSYLGFPCYLVAAGLAFWRPAVTLVICGALWVVWTIEAPRLAAERS